MSMDDYLFTAEQDGARWRARWRIQGGRLERLDTHDGTPILFPTVEAAELAAARQLVRALNGAAVPQHHVMLRPAPPAETAPPKANGKAPPLKSRRREIVVEVRRPVRDVFRTFK